MDLTEFCVAYPETPQTCKQFKCYNMLKGAKKVIFTACHFGQAEANILLAQTSFQQAPKTF